MATMDATDRAQAWINIMKTLSSEVDVGDSAVRAAILAAVEDADDWVDTNQSSYNAALPDPFATWATPRQKAALLTFVLHERFNAGTDE
jgi:hypothetical protein